MWSIREGSDCMSTDITQVSPCENDSTDGGSRASLTVVMVAVMIIRR